jgi:amino acid transporter
MNNLEKDSKQKLKLVLSGLIITILFLLTAIIFCGGVPWIDSVSGPR